jgi:hypothetical protein
MLSGNTQPAAFAPPAVAGESVAAGAAPAGRKGGGRGSVEMYSSVGALKRRTTPSAHAHAMWVLVTEMENASFALMSTHLSRFLSASKLSKKPSEVTA